MSMIAFVLLLGPDPDVELPRTLGQAPPPPQAQAGPDFGLSAGAKARWSTPFGFADGEIGWISGPGGTVVFVDDTISWSDLFHSGWGGEIEIAVTPGASRGHPESLRTGFYLALEIDHFEGDSVSSGSSQVRPGDLDMATLIVGGKGTHRLSEGTVASGRVGIGAVHYSAVEATYTGPLVPAVTGEFLEDTWTFAFETRGGVGVKLGVVVLSVGLGMRILGPPREGDGLDMDSGAFWTFDLDFGAELGF